LVHVELATTDLARAKTFCGSPFGCKPDDVDSGGGRTYTIIGVGDGTGGDMTTRPSPGAPSSWVAFAGVDEIGTATEKAGSLGATVMREPSEVPRHGHDRGARSAQSAAATCAVP